MNLDRIPEWVYWIGLLLILATAILIGESSRASQTVHVAPRSSYEHQIYVYTYPPVSTFMYRNWRTAPQTPLWRGPKAWNRGCYKGPYRNFGFYWGDYYDGE